MDIWYLLFASLSIAIIFDCFINKKKIKPNLVTFVIVIILSTLVGLRGEVGKDVESYISIFNSIPIFGDNTLYPYIMGNRIEPLYIFVISVFKFFIPEYNAYLFFQTIIVISIYSWSLYRIKSPINIGLYFYFLLYYLYFYNQQRMAIVFSLSFLSITFLGKKQFFKFYFVAIISILFHYVAFFLLLAPLLIILINKYITKLQKKLPGSDDKLKRFKEFRKYHLNHFNPLPSLPSLESQGNTRLDLAYIKILLLILFSIIFSTYIINIKVIAIFLSAQNHLHFITPVRSLLNYLTISEDSDIDINIVNAWRGLLVYFLILICLFFQRRYWIHSQNADTLITIYHMMIAGWIFWLFNYELPWIAFRVRDIYWSGFIGLAPIVILNEKRLGFPIAMIAVVILSVYTFYSRINELGPYISIL